MRVFDVRQTFEDARVEFVLGDITKVEDIGKACKVCFSARSIPYMSSLLAVEFIMIIIDHINLLGWTSLQRSVD